MSNPFELDFDPAAEGSAFESVFDDSPAMPSKRLSVLSSESLDDARPQPAESSHPAFASDDDTISACSLSFAHQDVVLNKFLHISNIVRESMEDEDPSTAQTPSSISVLQPEEPADPVVDFASPDVSVLLQSAFQSYDLWFRTDISRNDVDMLLADACNGAFIIRPSSQQGLTALCLKFDSLVLHYLIERLVFSFYLETW